jgi:hypothetical protein
MLFLVFAPLVFLLLRLASRWRTRTILIVAVVVALVLDVALNALMAYRR